MRLGDFETVRILQKATKGTKMSGREIYKWRALTALWLRNCALGVQDIRSVMRASSKEGVRRWVARGERLARGKTK
jgi:hypothetical protein